MWKLLRLQCGIWVNLMREVLNDFCQSFAQHSMVSMGAFMRDMRGDRESKLAY